ncbi:unnamed protein product, partial [Notodromas monacha]
MKNSALLNVLHKTAKLGSNKQQNGSKTWIHSPEALQSNHVVYLVKGLKRKFLGCTEVEQPKGTDVIREGIRKLKFNQQLKKAEGAKPNKVELTVSIDGVTIQDPKTKTVMHKYPLHRISYCADDKLEKRFFSFIAKEAEEGRHMCFVFVSDKLAEEITLTIGQAFDLAYRRFLDSQGKDLEARKQTLLVEKRAKMAEAEVMELKSRLRDLAAMLAPQDLDNGVRLYASISDVLELNIPEENLKNLANGDGSDSKRVVNLISDFDVPALSTLSREDSSDDGHGLDALTMSSPPPPVPPRTNAAPSPTTGDLLGEIDASFDGAPPAVPGPSIVDNLNWKELEELESPPPAVTSKSNGTPPMANGHPAIAALKLSPPPGKNPPPLPVRQSASSSGLLSDMFSSPAAMTNTAPNMHHAASTAALGDRHNPFAPRGHDDPFGMGQFGNNNKPAFPGFNGEAFNK